MLHRNFYTVLLCSRSLNRNAPIDWSERFVLKYKFLLSTFLSGNILIIKKIGIWSEMSVFIIPDLKPVCILEFVVILSITQAICLATRMNLLIAGIIPKRNIRFKKLVTFLFLLKSRKLMLKSLAKFISLIEIFRFQGEFLNLAQYFSNFCFQHRQINIWILWNLPGSFLDLHE